MFIKILVWCYLMSFGLIKCVSPVMAKAPLGAKTLDCSFTKIKTIRVPYNKLTILSFSERPVKVLSGQNVFDIKFIKNDLALKAIKTNSNTNLFVYLKDKTCAFEVTTMAKGGDEIVLVRGGAK